MFIQAIFKDSRKVKRIKNYGSKCKLYLSVFLDIAKVVDFQWKNADDVRRTQGCVT